MLSSSKDQIVGKTKIPSDFINLWTIVVKVYVGLGQRTIKPEVFHVVCEASLDNAMCAFADLMSPGTELEELYVLGPRSSLVVTVSGRTVTERGIYFEPC